VTRFPEHLPADIEVHKVDLDNEQVTFRGDRLTEARAESVADEILQRANRDRPPSDGAE